MSERHHRTGTHVVVINPASAFHGATGVVVPTTPHSDHTYVRVPFGSGSGFVTAAFHPDELHRADAITRLGRVAHDQLSGISWS